MGRKRKHTGKYDRKTPLKVGDPLPGGGVITNPNAGKDKKGRLLVDVRYPCGPDCKDCHGKPKRVRADNLRSGRVVSCGKIKRARRRDYMAFQRANSGEPYEPTEADLEAAESLRTHVIDYLTGEEIPMAKIKSIRRQGSATPVPDHTPKPIRPVSESGENGLPCQPGIGEMRTAPHIPKPCTPELESIVKYLTVQNGTVTFGSVPCDVTARWRNEGRNIREELEHAGYLKSCLITPKGADWFKNHGFETASVNPDYHDVIGEGAPEKAAEEGHDIAELAKHLGCEPQEVIPLGERNQKLYGVSKQQVRDAVRHYHAPGSNRHGEAFIVAELLADGTADATLNLFAEHGFIEDAVFDHSLTEAGNRFLDPDSPNQFNPFIASS